MKVYLTAIIKSKPGSAETLKPLITALISASTQETGCEQYELFHSTEDENIFILHETWQDQEILDAHNKADSIKDFIRDAGAILDGSIIVYKTQKGL